MKKGITFIDPKKLLSNTRKDENNIKNLHNVPTILKARILYGGDKKLSKKLTKTFKIANFKIKIISH